MAWCQTLKVTYPPIVAALALAQPVDRTVRIHTDESRACGVLTFVWFDMILTLNDRYTAVYKYTINAAKIIW